MRTARVHGGCISELAQLSSGIHAHSPWPPFSIIPPCDEACLLSHLASPPLLEAAALFPANCLCSTNTLSPSLCSLGLATTQYSVSLISQSLSTTHNTPHRPNRKKDGQSRSTSPPAIHAPPQRGAIPHHRSPGQEQVDPQALPVDPQPQLRGGDRVARRYEQGGSVPRARVCRVQGFLWSYHLPSL